MGWNDHHEDSELCNLPSEAWGHTFDVDGPFDPDDVWLRCATKDDQQIAMREWFTARYCDPALETPYIGREGGYLFVNGGPNSPDHELQTRFGRIVDGDVIQEVVSDLVLEVGDQWAPIRESFPNGYDERFDLEVVAPDEPLRRMEARIHELKNTLSLQSDAMAKALVTRLVFSALISVLESFLWETAQHWIEQRGDVLRRCIEKLPAFRDRPITLGDVFNQHEKIKETVKGYLQNLVWHRWDQVGALYRIGLDIQLPSVKSFEQPLKIRHDIVHRSGTDVQGNYIDISEEKVSELAQNILVFSAEVAKACSKKFTEDF